MSAGDVVPSDAKSRALTVAVVEHQSIGYDLNGLMEYCLNSISKSADLSDSLVPFGCH